MTLKSFTNIYDTILILVKVRHTLTNTLHIYIYIYIYTHISVQILSTVRYITNGKMFKIRDTELNEIHFMMDIFFAVFYP
jgi:hypothetical protein